MISVEVETQKVIETFLEKLKKQGLQDEIDMIEVGDFSSEICQEELLPELDKVDTECQLKNRVIKKLEQKLEIEIATGNNATVGKITKAIKEVEIGDYSSPVVKKIKTDIDAEIKAEKIKHRKKESNLSLQEIVDKYNIYMTRTGGLYWYYQAPEQDKFGNRQWYSLKKDTLQANFGATNIYIRGGQGEPDYTSFKEFCDLLVDQNKVFTEVIQSYTDRPGCLNVMQKNFCEPAADGSTDYHWIFDALIESLSGGPPGSKPFTAFQQTVFSKYSNPDNPFLPNLFVKNNDGRCGKGLAGNTFLMTLFAGSVADNCNIDHILGKFNAVIAGKAVIVVNETTREKVNVEKLKAFLGSPKFIVEEKFLRPYYADNTALVISFSNSDQGGISLSGTKSDERYSMFSTDYVFREVLQRYFKIKDNVSKSEQECKIWLESNDKDSGQNILSDKEQVGKWINAMYAKYNKIDSIESFHDGVYDQLIDKQRGAWTQTVEQVFTEPDFVYIRESLLRDLILHHNRGEIIPGKNHMRKEIERLCKDKGINVVWKDKVTIKFGPGNSPQRTVWKLNDGSGTVKNDEGKYGSNDAGGRWGWVWVA